MMKLKNVLAAAAIVGSLGFAGLGQGAGVANADDGNGPWIPWVPWHPGEIVEDWIPWHPGDIVEDWVPRPPWWHGGEGEGGD
jgi:hypothetical protein